jgi:hypothetical protein
MAYGFEIRNDYGTVQVDDTFKNLALKSKSTLTTTSPYPSGGSSQVLLSLTAPVTPVIALRCAVEAVITFAYIGGGVAQYLIAANGPVGTTIDCYVFDEPAAPTMSGYGTVINDPSGNTIFDGSQKYLRVVDFIGPIGSTVSTAPHTYVSGRIYAAAVTSLAYNRTVIPWVPVPGYAIAVENFIGAKNVTDGVQLGLVPIKQEGPGPGIGGTWDLPGYLTVIDVTDY